MPEGTNGFGVTPARLQRVADLDTLHLVVKNTFIQAVTSSEEERGRKLNRSKSDSDISQASSSESLSQRGLPPLPQLPLRSESVERSRMSVPSPALGGPLASAVEEVTTAAGRDGAGRGSAALWVPPLSDLALDSSRQLKVDHSEVINYSEPQSLRLWPIEPEVVTHGSWPIEVIGSHDRHASELQQMHDHRWSVPTDGGDTPAHGMIDNNHQNSLSVVKATSSMPAPPGILLSTLVNVVGASAASEGEFYNKHQSAFTSLPAVRQAMAAPVIQHRESFSSFSTSSEDPRGSPRISRSRIDQGNEQLTQSAENPFVAMVHAETGVAIEQLTTLYSQGLLQQIPRDEGALTSIGSVSHWAGDCRPCIFWFRDACTKGLSCAHCHFLHRGQKHKKIKPSRSTRLKRRAEGETGAGEEQHHLEQ